MGTRADFYVRRGKDAEWLGSIAWDGYPAGNPKPLLNIVDEAHFRSTVAEIIEKEGGTFPHMGWPWPWNDSNTTDYSYAFDAGRVWGTCFGRGWWPADAETEGTEGKLSNWPDMSSRRKLAIDPQRSGIFIIGT